jgi:hypothetical protein
VFAVAVALLAVLIREIPLGGRNDGAPVPTGAQGIAAHDAQEKTAIAVLGSGSSDRASRSKRKVPCVCR